MQSSILLIIIQFHISKDYESIDSSSIKIPKITIHTKGVFMFLLLRVLYLHYFPHFFQYFFLFFYHRKSNNIQ